MNNEDANTSSLNSTDTSQFLRELQALNQNDSSTSYPGSATGSREVGGSGDATLTQLMRTIYSSAPRQKIVLPGNSEQDSSFSIYGREVDIYVASSEDGPRAGSNKVKITPVVNHAWEQRYYYGNLVAVHRDGDFVAFALKGKPAGIVRVISRRSAERTLLKGFTGSVLDVAFAHSEDVILAAVDEVGNLFVYSCQSGSGGIVATPLLSVSQPSSAPSNEYRRIIWCPYWPDDEEDDADGLGQDSSKMLAVTQEEKIELWAVDIVTRDYGAGPLSRDEVESGRIVVIGHTQPIVDAVFSPDGTALATASLDGEVKFFQVDWSEAGSDSSPRCLHQWKPHDGQPLSYLAFLDDLTNMTPDAQFWKYAVTGANKNQELKLWSCESWSCLQTVRFLAPPDSMQSGAPMLKACTDASSRFIVLSDKLHMVLYVMQIHQDNVVGTAHVSSVSEFPLTQPCLSFAILEACTKLFKASPNDSHLDEITTGELEQETEEARDLGDENGGPTTPGVQIRLYGVHTRALQELLIRFRPQSSVSALDSAAGSVSHDGTSLRDGLSDMSAAADASFAEGEGTGESVSDVARPPAQPTQLLTPDDFTTPVSKEASPAASHSNVSAAEDVLSSTSSFTHVTGLTGQNAEDLLLSPDSSAADISAVGVLSPPAAPPAKALASLTPTQNGFQAAGLTPTNIPLPPEEENELATPTSSQLGTDTPKSTQRSIESNTPRSHQSARSEGTGQVGDVLEAFFQSPGPGSVNVAVQQGDGDVASSTGSFEIEKDTPKDPNISATASDQGGGDGPETYDENDQEVAEVLGEDLDKSFESATSGTDTAHVDHDLPSAHVPEDERPHKPWPRPPDVSSEAKSAQEERGSKSGEGAEDEYSEDQNEEEEEAEIEEEIEEVVDEDDVDDMEDETEGRELEQRGFGGPARAPRQARVEIIREVVDRNMLTELQECIGKLSAEVGRQQQQLAQLHQRLVEQHEVQVELQRQQLEQTTLRSTAHPIPDLEQQLGKVQNVVASRVERTLSQTLQRETKSLHDRIASNESRAVAAQESLQRGVTQALSAATQKSLETLVKNEFKHSVTPMLQKAMDQLKEQMHTDVAQKVTATDAILKDTISKMVRSRQTTEAIATAATNALQGPIQSHLRDVFQSHVIPSFEHSTQTMANQVNAAFQAGTREYTSHLRSHLEQVRQEQASARDPIVSQLKELVDSFKRDTQNMQEQVVQTLRAEVSGKLTSSLQSFQEQVNTGLRNMVRSEISAAMREHDSTMSDRLATYLRSGAATPVPSAPTPDPATVQAQQAQIRHLVNANRLNEAFQTALTASNLELVVFVCELVDPGQVFSATPCPLSQPVLLSLIQQLSADLQTSLQTKIKYLTEAVTSLDPNEVVTREHIPTVLEALVAKLRRYQASHPPNKEIKLLLMAAMSLLPS